MLILRQNVAWYSTNSESIFNQKLAVNSKFSVPFTKFISAFFPHFSKQTLLGRLFKWHHCALNPTEFLLFWYEKSWQSALPICAQPMKESSQPDMEEKWTTDNVCIYSFWSIKKQDYCWIRCYKTLLFPPLMSRAGSQPSFTQQSTGIFISVVKSVYFVQAPQGRLLSFLFNCTFLFTFHPSNKCVHCVSPILLSLRYERGFVASVSLDFLLAFPETRLNFCAFNVFSKYKTNLLKLSV